MQKEDALSTQVVIVGAGPIGIELAIALKRQNIPAILLEANQVGDAFTRWPPNTRFFSTPEHVALAGVPVQTVGQEAITGEAYLAYLRMLVEMFDLNVHVYEPVTAVHRHNAHFTIKTQPRSGPRIYKAANVVLATGGMAGPRLLNIPGEELPHVTHYFPGPHPYFRTKVLVVGGKNSAMEAALRCWRGGAAQVALSYRRATLNTERIKPHLAMDIHDRLKKGEIQFFPSTVPTKITATHVTLAATQDGQTPDGYAFLHETDFVILATGFQADMTLFSQAGVTLHGVSQVPEFDEMTMETNIPGLYVAGTAAGGTQERFKYFISTTHDHVAKIVKHITGNSPGALGTIPSRNNAVTFAEVKAN